MRDLRRQNGFSFIEILISVILVGLSITALVVASSSFTVANGAGADLSTAEFLIEQIRELTTLLPLVDPTTTVWNSLGAEGGESSLAAYDDVDDFDGFDSTSLGAPIDANRSTLPTLNAFSQSVTVQKVNQSDFTQVVSDLNGSPFARVTVVVSLNGREISSASWIRANF
jgi:type II secretory pathway pseudopilin PulG